MPCYTPNQVYYSLRPDGKKDITFSNVLGDLWRRGLPMPSDTMGLPCGQCRGCRLETSRCVAVRCMHELEMHSSSCFGTLTYAPEHLPLDRSVSKRVMQDFMHDLRQKCARGFEYVDSCGKLQFYQKTEGIRYLYSGEYGDKFSRPHYHFILFGFDFPDKRYFKRSKGGRIYVSKMLSGLWPFGHHGIGMVSFESAAYVGRYCVKKVTGAARKDHYCFVDSLTGQVFDLTPEFAEPSRKPGLGRLYLEKNFSDIYPRDFVLVKNKKNPNGIKTRPPRYYDDVCKEHYPDIWKQVQASRLEKRLLLPDDAFSFDALAKKEELIKRKMSEWTRSIESGVYL
jgi:hypothetical protein